MDFIQDFVVNIATSLWVLPIVFGLCLMDGFFPPLPSESVMIAMGSLYAANGNIYIFLIAVCGAIGASTGDIIAYHIGRHIPLYRISFLNNDRGKKALDLAEHSLAAKGVFYILTARFIPVGRIAVNMVAGATGYPRFKFVLTAFCAGAIWSFYLISLGYGVGAVLYHNPLLGIAVGIVLGILFGFVLEKLISFVGNIFARLIANGSIKFFRWLNVEDISGQGIKINEEKIFHSDEQDAECKSFDISECENTIKTINGVSESKADDEDVSDGADNIECEDKDC